MKSRQDLLREARQRVREVSVNRLHDQLAQGRDPALLDVRGLDEWDMGHLEGAVHIPRSRLEAEVESRLPDKSREVIVYCAGGVRSLLAGEALQELGYTDVASLSGGFEDWEDAGHAVARPPAPEEAASPGSPELLKAEIEHLERLVRKKKALLAGVA